MLGKMQINFNILCNTKPILHSNSCNLYVIWIERGFNVNCIFSNTMVGMLCTGCSFTSQSVKR